MPEHRNAPPGGPGEPRADEDRNTLPTLGSPTDKPAGAPTAPEAPGTPTLPEAAGQATPTLLTQGGHSGAAPTSPPSAAPGPANWPTVPGYTLLAVLGKGGMGVVYKARQERLNRPVALKMILAGAHADAQDAARFKTEAEAVARLQHPNIVQIYEVDEHGGLPFFSLEFVGGGSLGDRLRGATLPPAEAARLAETLARAAHAAHRAGVVHRDLKPANVLLTDDGVPKITDFGLAKKLDDVTGQTVSGAVMGTPGYMAPEQAAGRTREVGPAADVYALGAVLYEMLTGRPPFRGETILDTLEQVRSREPERPRRLAPKVPRDLETICLKCLEKAPAKRYPGAEEMADDLRRFLKGEPIRARRAWAWERGVKWARRRPTAAALAGLTASLLLAAAVGAVWYWNAYRRVTVDSFAGIMNRRGVWEGAGPLTDQQARQRPVSYRVHRRAGRVERVEVVNGSGVPTPFHATVAYLDDLSDAGRGRTEVAYEFRYDGQGQLTEQVALDREGRVVWTFHFTGPTTGHYTDDRGFPRPRAGSGGTYAEFVWTDEGLAREIHYLDRNGKASCGKDGIYGIRQEFDRRGFRTRLSFLGPGSQPVWYKLGMAGIAEVRNDLDCVLEASYFDLDGKPVLRREGGSRYTWAYDDSGNPVEMAAFGPDGRPALLNEGYAKLTRSYDGRGNQTGEAYFGPDGKPALHRDGYAAYKAEHDGRGNVTAVAYFGPDGRPTVGKEGYARREAVYDERDNLARLAYFGPDGKPALHKSGNAGFTAACDEHRNRVEEAYFGPDGRPALVREGFAKLARTYDDRHNVLTEAYFGPDGRPATHRNGFARLTNAYDDRGNRIETAYFDRDGKPALHKDGYAKITWKYDDQGNYTEVAYLDRDGKPTLHKGGYARFTRTCDDRGNCTSEASFGVDGKPMLNRDGCARTTSRYDDRGNQLEMACFGVDGKPTLHKGGYFRWSSAYDERGNLTETAYLGTDDRPAACKDGYARVRRVPDARGNLLEVAFFGTDGRPALRPEGYARFTNVYDDRGNRVESRCFGPDGKPVVNTDGYARFTKAFDARGNELEVAYFGTDDKPVPCRDGYARAVRVYDDRGNQTEETCYGPDGRQVTAPEGWSRRTVEYDGRGHPVRETWYGPDGRPTAQGGRPPCVTRAYDDRGNEVETAYFAPDGKPAPHKDGYARVTYTWDAPGNLTGVAYFGPDGRPVRAAAGYAALTRALDDHGEQTDVSFFDEAGKRLALRVRVARVSPGSQGERLGLQAGDVLASYGGKAVTSSFRFVATRRGERPGDGPVELKVLRGDQPLTLSVTPGLLGVDLENKIAPARKDAGPEPR